MMNRTRARRGSLLIVVLWMVAILAVLAVGLGQKVRVDLALTRYAMGRLRARYAAWAGVMYALYQIQRDGQTPATRNVDTLYQCGVALPEGRSAREVFQGVPLTGGFFDVGYRLSQGQQAPMAWGVSDEERKININALTVKNYGIVARLLEGLGFDPDLARTVAASIVDWRDRDDRPTDAPFGAEEAYYATLPRAYPCKNRPFDHLEELLLVRGVSREVFERARPFLTVFPKEGARLLVNVNTASAEVLRALARSFVGGETNTDEQDADALVEKILLYRAGGDEEAMTADDRPVDMRALPLNAREKVIFLAMRKYLVGRSRYFSVRVRGVDQASGVVSEVEAVVSRRGPSIVAWQRDPLRGERYGLSRDDP